MYGNLMKSTICAGLMMALGACGLFADEKIKLEGERLSVLSSSAKLQPDFPEGKVKICRTVRKSNFNGVMSSIEAVESFWAAINDEAQQAA